MNRQQPVFSRAVSPVPAPTDSDDLTASEALQQARDDINAARAASISADARRQAECVRLAIDAATTTLLNPSATRREVVAAHSFLHEALELGGQSDAFDLDPIDTASEASMLSPDDQKWLGGYLQAAPVDDQAVRTSVAAGGLRSVLAAVMISALDLIRWPAGSARVTRPRRV